MEGSLSNSIERKSAKKDSPSSKKNFRTTVKNTGMLSAPKLMSEKLKRPNTKKLMSRFRYPPQPVFPSDLKLNLIKSAN